MIRLLVIDDEPLVHAQISHMLKDEAYVLEHAPDGEVGLRLFQKFEADIVLTDIMMPQTDGIEVICELQRVSPWTPVIAMSGSKPDGFYNLLLMSTRLGAAATLQKPFVASELLATLEYVVGKLWPQTIVGKVGAQ